MAVNVFVPTQTLPEDEESKAFVYAQCLLMNKTTHAPTPDEGYRQFLRDAQGAPFCTLDASGTKERDLKGPFGHTANTVLKDVIPRNMASLDPTVTALLLPQVGRQSLPDSGVPEFNKLFTATKPQRPDDPTIVEAFFLSTPAWSPPTFEAYYLKIESRKAPQGMLGRWTQHEQKFHISGTCHCSRFSVNTPMLVQFMKKKEDADTNIASYLSRAIKCTAIQPQSHLPVSDDAFKQK